MRKESAVKKTTTKIKLRIKYRYRIVAMWKEGRKRNAITQFVHACNQSDALQMFQHNEYAAQADIAIWYIGLADDYLQPKKKKEKVL